MASGVRVAVIAAVLVGVAVGLSAYTFGYAKGYSYLTNDPAACANCHVMSEHFEAWNKSSHRAVATCNDCHTPHTVIGKYATKANNGFWHSFYFTTGRFPDPLRITDRNRRVTERACRDCHEEIVAAIDPRPNGGGDGDRSVSLRANPAHTETSCIRCHRYVGHLVR